MTKRAAAWSPWTLPAGPGAAFALVCLPLVVVVDRLLGAPVPNSIVDALLLVCLAAADRSLVWASLAYLTLWVISWLVGGSHHTWAEDLCILLSVLAGLQGRQRWRLVVTAACLLMLMRPWQAPNVPAVLARGAVVLGGFVAVWVLVDLFVMRLRRAEEADRALREQRYGIARELHDSVAYQLSMTSMKVQQAQIAGGTSADGVGFVVEEIAGAIRSLEHLMVWLREDTAGVLPETAPSAAGAVARFVERLTDASFRVSLTQPATSPAISAKTEWVLAGILRELANNILRHADRAVEVTVQAEFDNDHMLLLVVNGRIDTPWPAGHPDRDLMGLAGMSERAALIRGRVVSTPLGDVWTTSVALPAFPDPDGR